MIKSTDRLPLLPAGKTAAPRSVAPRRDDLAVLSCHFNFAEFSTPRRNLQRFLRQMDRERVESYGVELLLPGQIPQTSGRPGWAQIRVGRPEMLLQKEALVNAAAKLVKPSVRFLVEIDPDLWFESPEWADATVDMLQRHPCAQPFSAAVWTGREGEVELERGSAAAVGLSVSPWLGHPGFAWAVRRDFLQEVGGWYDLAILGGGDLLWALAVLGGDISPEAAAARVGLGAEPDGYAAYHDRVRRAMGDARPGAVPGRVFHEYHGARSARGYTSRAALLEGLRPSRHLRRRRDGVLAWTRSAPREMRDRVAGHFATREEDL